MDTPPSSVHKIVDFLKTLAIAGFLAFFCIRGFMVEPFKIPSSSMMPTLLIGDYLVVSKFAYGNRLPLTDFFFWQREPQRGDIIVFKREGSGLPGSFFGLGKTLFIKRLIGLPGDTIRFDGPSKTLYINGQAVTQTHVGTYNLTPRGMPTPVELKTEDLVGVQHSILADENVQQQSVAETTVPPGMYVVMGDNRDNSRDSRFWEWPSWGYVPKADIMGRAEFIFWSWDETFTPRLSRIGTGLSRAHGPVTAE